MKQLKRTSHVGFNGAYYGGLVCLYCFPTRNTREAIKEESKVSLACRVRVFSLTNFLHFFIASKFESSSRNGVEGKRQLNKHPFYY